MFIKGHKPVPRKTTVSRAKAIREKCKDCTYDEHEPGTWLQQVTACNDDTCALWSVRPKTSHPAS